MESYTVSKSLCTQLKVDDYNTLKAHIAARGEKIGGWMRQAAFDKLEKERNAVGREQEE